MQQHNQIGKYIKKEMVLKAKNGKTFVTPLNNSYIFSYIKQGNRYIFIIEYKNRKMEITESEFNKTNIDDLLATMNKVV